LRILSHNLFAWNGRKEETVRFILESNADVVGLTEVEFGWSAALAPLRSVYPFRRIELQDGCFGMALFSKVPVEELTSTSEDGPLRISATLIRPWSERGPQRVALHVMHPPPPMGSGPYQLRRRILQRPGSLRDRTPDVIVLGDFNTGPWSADYRAAFPRQEWRNVREGFGLMPTWQSTMPWPLGLSIDHIVMTRSIRAVEAWTDEGIGSDHRPIVASLVPTDDVHYPHKINESEGEMPVG
jgi:endonuclease/exonuclease/phosphatase (EEP) superfamily protein YafD